MIWGFFCFFFSNAILLLAPTTPREHYQSHHLSGEREKKISVKKTYFSQMSTCSFETIWIFMIVCFLYTAECVCLIWLICAQELSHCMLPLNAFIKGSYICLSASSFHGSGSAVASSVCPMIYSKHICTGSDIINCLWIKLLITTPLMNPSALVIPFEALSKLSPLNVFRFNGTSLVILTTEQRSLAVTSWSNSFFKYYSTFLLSSCKSRWNKGSRWTVLHNSLKVTRSRQSRGWNLEDLCGKGPEERTAPWTFLTDSSWRQL